MSENTATETTAIETEATDQETTNAEPQGEAKGETDWKSEARKWESRAKASKADSDDAAKWREYESSQKSDHEKLAEELARKSAEAEEAKATLLRYEVANEKGISGDATRLLKGSSREELESEAELLLALIANNNKPKTPLPDDNQGKPNPATLGQLTEADLKTMKPEEIIKAKSEGRLDTLLGRN